MRLHLRPPAFGPAHMVLAVAALLLTLFAYSTVQTAMQSFRLQEQRRELEGDVAELRLQRAELQGLREYIASDEYIEYVARSQLGLVRPGETAVIVDAPAAPTPEPAPDARWWERLFAR